MNTLPETTSAPSVSEGKFAFQSASTVDTLFCSEFSLGDCPEDDVLPNVNSLDASERSSKCRRAAVRKSTAKRCDGAKTRISPNRGKTNDSRRKPKLRSIRSQSFWEVTSETLAPIYVPTWKLWEATELVIANYNHETQAVEILDI